MGSYMSSNDLDDILKQYGIKPTEKKQQESKYISDADLNNTLSEYGIKRTTTTKPTTPASSNTAKSTTPASNSINIDSTTSKELAKYSDKYRNKVYEDDFGGQFSTNKDLGRLSQDAALAWNDYLSDPTEQNLQKAETIQSLLEDFQQKNQEALDDENVKAGWISKSFAGYLPQLADQAKAGIAGIAIGGGAGAAVGSVVPVVGTAAGAIFGAKAGLVGAETKLAYETMRGQAYQNLIQMGVDPETAKKAAQDEAIVSALVEMVDSGIDVATLGIGKVIKTGAKALAKQGAKEAAEKAQNKLVKGLVGYGINVAAEGAQEGVQESVSIANENRLANGATDTGIGNLASRSASELVDPANRERITGAAQEGSKIAAMFGGGTLAVNTAISNTIDSRTQKRNQLKEQIIKAGYSKETADRVVDKVMPEQKQEADIIQPAENIQPIVNMQEKARDNAIEQERPVLTPLSQREQPIVAEKQPIAEQQNNIVNPSLPNNQQNTAAGYQPLAQVPEGNGEDLLRGMAANSVPKAAEAGNITQESAQDIKTSPEAIYKAVTLGESMEAAQVAINKLGFNPEIEMIKRMQPNQPALNSSEVAMAAKLIMDLSADPSPEMQDKAVALTESLMAKMTDAARALNALKLLQMNSPTAYVALARRTAAKTGIELDAQTEADIRALGNLARTGTLSDDDLTSMSDKTKDWVNTAEAWADDDTDISTLATAKAMQEIYDLVPKTFRQKFRALQRISMLSSPKTHARNILGNTMLSVTEFTAHPFAYMFDQYLSTKTGQRTVGSGGMQSRIDGTKEGVRNTVRDYKLGLDMTSNRFDEKASGSGKIFNDVGIGKMLNKADEGIRTLLKLGDEPFRNGQFKSVLAQMMKANNVTEATPEMMEAAIESAYVRTFQDDNAVSKAFQHARDGAGIVGDVAMPFVKTPTNVIKVGMEYSPIGIAEALGKTFVGKNSIMQKKARGESTMLLQRKAAELFGRGFVGTALLLFGLVSGAEGWATGDDEENAKERAWDETKGEMGSSIKVGDNYVDLSSLQTAATPFLAGAAVQGDIGIMNALAAMLRVGDSSLDMPVLSGLQQLFGNYGDASLGGIAGEMAGNAALQVVPGGTLLRQAATFIDDGTVRSTKSDNTSDVGKEIGTAYNRFKSMIPGARQTLPTSYDTLGNEKKSYNADTAAGRFFNTFINPFNTSKENKTAVTEELDNLYAETQDRDILPRVAPGDFSADNQQYKLTSAEQQDFQRQQGGTTNTTLTDLFADAAFKAASTEEKVRMVSAVLDYAYDATKAEYIASKGGEYSQGNLSRNAEALKEQGVSYAKSIAYYAKLKDVGTADEKRQLLYDAQDLTAEEKQLIGRAFVSENDDTDYSSEESYTISRLSDAGKRQWDMAQKYMDYNTYSTVYPIAVSSGKRKAESIAELMNLGYTEEQAYAVYAICRGTGSYKVD